MQPAADGVVFCGDLGRATHADADCRVQQRRPLPFLPTSRGGTVSSWRRHGCKTSSWSAVPAPRCRRCRG